MRTRPASTPRDRSLARRDCPARPRSLPRHRYATAQEMLDDLHEPSRVKPGTWSAAPRRRTTLGVRLPRGLGVTLVLALVMGLLTFLIWKTSHNMPRRTTPGRSYREEVR